jgi:D-glycero-D-manno-heptose 1,7-bisphosphate phosphatase
MLEEAKRDHQIAVEKSWFIGDKDTDILCGRRAGCKTILVLTGYGKNYRDSGPHFIAKDIVEAAEIVLADKT